LSTRPAPVDTLRATESIRARVAELGPWYHDIELPGGIRTAPDHPLGGFQAEIWRHVRRHLPRDLRGATVLDVGCNAGFYAQQLARRGASVVGVDHDERYLEQARFAAAANGVDIEFRRMDAYDVGALDRRFDFVLFLGVFYHLRHPLLALDRIAAAVGRRLLVQSMVRGAPGVVPVPLDAGITDTAMFEHPRFPAMFFIEHSYAGDPTNWWVPNEAGMAALLRAAGLRVCAHPFRELWVCEPAAGTAAPARAAGPRLEA
jgi:tRNA (mo5U34)-methyltransferase